MITDRVYKLENDVTRAEAAQREFRLLKEAFDKYRAGVFAVWQGTDPRDEKGREKLWVATTILSEVERTFLKLIQQGEVAAKELEAIRMSGEAKKPSSFLRRII